MKTFRIILSIALIAVFLPAFSQTLDEAGAAFNQGIQFTKDLNYAEALRSYESTIQICEKLGDEGMELQLKAEQQMPNTYFNIAKGYYEAKKYNEAILNFESASTWADKMGESKTADASRTYLAGIYTAQGNADLKAEAYDKAFEKYNKALTYKPEYYKAYYGMGLTYKKQDNLPLMKESLDKVISMAGDDAKTIGQAKDAAASAYLNTGAKALQGNGFSKAIENLNASLEYDTTNYKAYYYLALAYNGTSKWDDAIGAANKALELTTEDKSDIYFELGKSFEKKGDNAAACDAYKKVTGGNNVEPAKYQVTQVLKCN
jgi:tetratricopeptide (TPR) repeat protein